MLNAPKPLSQAIEDTLPSIAEKLTKKEKAELVDFIRMFHRNRMHESRDKKRAYAAINPLLGITFYEAFNATLKKYQITERMLLDLVWIHSIWAHPLNISGYFQVHHFADFFGDKNTRSISYRIRKLIRRGYLEKILDKTFIRNTHENNIRKTYLLTHDGERVVNHFRWLATQKLGKMVGKGVSLDIELKDMNHSHKYLDLLLILFNTNRRSFLRNGLHLTHGEIEMRVPNFDKLIVSELAEMEDFNVKLWRQECYNSHGRYKLILHKYKHIGQRKREEHYEKLIEDYRKKKNT